MNVTSLRALKPHLAVMQSFLPSFNPENPLYLTDNTANLGSKENLSVERTLCGIHIDLSDTSPLFHSLNALDTTTTSPEARPALNRLTMICDTLEINAPLRLPECHVAIYVRVLKIGPNGSLSTQPLPWKFATANDAALDNGTNKAPSNGAHGRDGGNISLWLGTPLQSANPKPFISSGGDGQNGGKGWKGQDGLTLETKSSFSREVGIWFGKHDLTVYFDPPAIRVYYFATGFFGGWYRSDETVWGSDTWPEDGKQGQKSGTGGNAGSAGPIASNLDLQSLCVMQSGKPGTAIASVGGAPGEPEKYARYEVKLNRSSKASDRASLSIIKKEEIPTPPKHGDPGEVVSGKPAARHPSFERQGQELAWLHPLLFAPVLNYLRDACLAQEWKDFHATMDIYLSLLNAQDAPATELWQSPARDLWNAAAAELTTLSTRPASHLDYFGKPAGYTPIWSLSSALIRYRSEAIDTMKTLLLTRWIDSTVSRVQGQEQADQALGKLFMQQTSVLVQDCEAGHKSLVVFRNRWEEIQGSEAAFRQKIKEREAELSILAKADAESLARWTAGLRILAAASYIIPLGQPFLGAGVTLATGLVTQFALNSPNLESTVATLGKSVSSAYSTYESHQGILDKKATEAAKEAETAVKRDGDRFSQAAYEKKWNEARTPDTAWESTVRHAPQAFEHLTAAIQKLTLPVSDLTAAVQKYTGKDEALAGLVKQLNDLLAEKEPLLGQLTSTHQRLISMQSNLASLEYAGLDLYRRSSSRYPLLSPVTARFARSMDQQARHALRAALYDLVRAYESTLFQPARHVDWNLDLVFAQVIKSLESYKPHDATSDVALIQKAEEVQPIFSSSLKPFVDGIIATFQRGVETEPTLKYTLSDVKLNRVHQTMAARAGDPSVPEFTESVLIDPMRKGLVPFDRERAFLTAITMAAPDIEFHGIIDPHTDGNLTIRISTSTEGIVRADDRLYIVRRDAPVTWGWAVSFRKGVPTFEADVKPAKIASLSSLLAPSTSQHEDFFMPPPAWSDLEVEVSYLSNSGNSANAPRIKRLSFDCHVAGAQPVHKRVALDLRCDDPTESILVTCPTSEDAPADAQPYRTQFFGLFNKGNTVTVSLASGRPAAWELHNGIGQLVPDGNHLKKGRLVTARSVTLLLQDHTKLRCKLAKASPGPTTPAETITPAQPSTISHGPNNLSS
jgi:hypothetical protein